ncbi:MAG: hypothetical protein IK114_14275 [Fibrobacter sp.]|nr:hypothetical protein [Fibrobacter sp.]
MLYVPSISDYKPFYLQFETGFAIDILQNYSVIVRAHDYPAALKVKEPYKNQWKDQHGDEEYISPLGLNFEAFTFKLECVIFARGASDDAAIAELKTAIRNFQMALSQGFMKTYDAYTGFGFRQVRLQEFPQPEEDAYSVWNGCTRVLFQVVLKVNDPVTSMVYNPANHFIVEG